MRILYQIPGDMRGGPLGAGELSRREAILQQWACRGAEVAVADAPGGPHAIESYVDEAACVPPMLAALAMRRSRPDAVIVGCFGDPGLAAVRQAHPAPVVGPFESSFHLAAQLGARVGIVTVSPSLVSMMDALARANGLDARYAGSTAIDVGVLALPRQGPGLIDQLADAARPLIEERRGADVLVLGCMSLSFLDVDRALSQALGVPVINPARAALATAETLARLALTSSRRTYPEVTGIGNGMAGGQGVS